MKYTSSHTFGMIQPVTNFLQDFAGLYLKYKLEQI